MVNKDEVTVVEPVQLEYEKSVCLLITRYETKKDGRITWRSVSSIGMRNVEQAGDWIENHVHRQPTYTTDTSTQCTGYAIVEVPLGDIKWQEPPE